MSAPRARYIAALRQLPFTVDGSDLSLAAMRKWVSWLSPHLPYGTYDNQISVSELRSAFTFVGPPLRCYEQVRVMTVRRSPSNRNCLMLYHENCADPGFASSLYRCPLVDSQLAQQYARDWWSTELHHRSEYGLRLYVQIPEGWRPVSLMSTGLLLPDSGDVLCPWSVSVAADTSLWEADSLCQAELPSGWEHVVAICGVCGGTFNTDEQCHTCGVVMRARGSLQTSVVPRSIPIGAEAALARVGYSFSTPTVTARLQEYAYWQDRMYETLGTRAAAQQKETYLKPGRTIELRS